MLKHISLALALAAATAHAVTIDAVYFGQTHVLKASDPYFGLVGEREALIKVHVTDPATPASPAVSATLSLGGQTLVLPLTGPATLPASIPDGLGVVQHSYANTFTGFLPPAWVKTGLQVTVNAGAATTTITNMKVGAPTKVIMTMFDVQYFADTNDNYPSGTFAELEAKWPVSDLTLRRAGHVVFPELVIPPRQDVGSKAVRIKSKAEYFAQTNLTFDGEQSAALAWNGALRRAAGRSGRWSLYYINVYNAFAGGQAGGFSGVGSGTSLGILNHELGHALSLPHWGDNGAYPYKGNMHGIQAPAGVYNETHSGPAWAFHLPTHAFIPPTVQAGNVGGKPVGTYKVDPMQGGGTGYQEPAYLMNHFSDYSVFEMRDYLHSHMVVWNQALSGGNGSWASWNQTAGGYTTAVTNNGVQFPTTRDVQVISIMASLCGANPGINMVYPPIGPYTSGLIRLFDPTVAADRTAAQSIFAPTNGCDFCVRVVQGGVTKTYMLAASSLSTADPFAESSLLSEAVNLPAADGSVTKIELLSTPNAEDVGLPANPTVLYTWAPLMPEPGKWDLVPTANSSTAITMTALPGEVAFGFTGGTIEYQFIETTGNPGGSDSAWQANRSYTDTGLTAGTQYSYTVAVRAGTLATTASEPASATTAATAPGLANITVDDTQAFALVDDSGYKEVTGLGTFDPGGSDKLVVVVAGENANNDHFAFSGVRYNGVQMIEVVQQTAGTADGAVAIYYLDNPGPIASGLFVSGYNPNGGMGTAYALSGTRAGHGAFNSKKGGFITGAPITTSANKSLVIAALENSNGGTPTVVAPLISANSGSWGGNWGGHASGYVQVATPAAAAAAFTTATGSSYSINIASVEVLAAPLAANTWVQTAGGVQSWTVAANWADGVVPNPASGVTMDFSAVNIAADTVLDLGANRTARLWKFGDTSGAQRWTVAAGNTITLAGTTPGFEVQSGLITVIDANVAGTAGLTKTDAGRLILTGTNSYTGGTTISAGTFQIGLDGATGNLPTGNVVNNGTLRFDRTGTITAANVISGTGTLYIDCPLGAGTITLSGANTFTGAVTINSGALEITHSAALGAGTKIVDINTGTTGNPQLLLDGSGGNITVPASISFQTSNDANGAIVNEAGNNSIAGPITLTGGGGNTRVYSNAGTLTLSGAVNSNFAGRSLKLMGASNGNVNGIISNGSPTLGVGVSKEEGGTWTLSGNNTFGGGASVVAGTLKIAHPNALGFGALMLSGSAGTTSITAGGVLDLNGQQGVGESITIRGTGIGNGGALINNSATAASIVSGVTNITTTAGGVHSAVPAVTISGGGGSGATATASLGLSAASFTIAGGTTVYSVAPTVSISGGGGTGESATAVLTGGVVTGITITSPGYDFTTAPTIAFSGGTVTTAGTNPTGTGKATNFIVAGIRVTNPGSGYTSAPTVTFGGTGTTAMASFSTMSLGANSSIGGSGNTTIHPGITGAFSLTKVGAGTVTLTGANSYTGGTIISSGTLALGASNVLPGTVAIGSASLNAATFSETLDTLDVTGSAVINLGTGAALSFANSSAIDWTGGTLTITGTFVSGSSIRFGTTSSGLSPAQLTAISAPGVPFIGINASGYLVASSGASYSHWQAANGTTGGFNADHDNDGVLNGIEYFLGGNGNTTGYTPLPSVTNTSAPLLITWTKSANYPGTYGTNFSVETTETLSGIWTTETLGGAISIVGNNITYTFPGGAQRFARLKVTGP